MDGPLIDILKLILGVIAAGLGGDLFVRALTGFSLWLRIAPMIVASTIAAFATSSPELSVSVTSAIQGSPEIALGDALGSNVINISLLLAIGLLFSDIRCSRDAVRRDFGLALIQPLILLAMSFDGLISRLDGLMLFFLFVTWVGLTVRDALHQRAKREVVSLDFPIWKMFGFALTGIVLLIISGNFIVQGSVSFAERFGINPFLIGATIVCVGTSMPELATTLISTWKGQVEIGLGTVLGSNLFNGLFIVSVASIISPIKVNLNEVIVTLIFGFISIALSFPNASGVITRKRGVLLLVIYLMYMVTVIQTNQP
ncbi:MAG: hypothetical protein RJA81_1380 [Planctomycetota bacterium]|jgi:cation:H+ antiporter